MVEANKGGTPRLDFAWALPGAAAPAACTTNGMVPCSPTHVPFFLEPCATWSGVGGAQC